jgi:hypothetical protein
MKKIKYNTDKHNFSQLVESYFFTKENHVPLKLIHTFKESADKTLGDAEVFTREKDQSTQFHKKFYEFARSNQFKSLYTNFIKDVVRPLYTESIVYQSIPTFRIHMPNNIAVGEFHKDKHYRDIKWAESVHEDNFFLPFTDAFDTNTIWVESEEDKGDFAPMVCNYGETIQWDGSNLLHGNKLNSTQFTRVSVDFRVIKYSNYIPSENASINTKVQFKIGGYYSFCE